MKLRVFALTLCFVVAVGCSSSKKKSDVTSTTTTTIPTTVTEASVRNLVEELSQADDREDVEALNEALADNATIHYDATAVGGDSGTFSKQELVQEVNAGFNEYKAQGVERNTSLENIEVTIDEDKTTATASYTEHARLSGTGGTVRISADSTIKVQRIDGQLKIVEYHSTITRLQ